MKKICKDNVVNLAFSIATAITDCSCKEQIELLVVFLRLLIVNLEGYLLQNKICSSKTTTTNLTNTTNTTDKNTANTKNKINK